MLTTGSTPRSIPIPHPGTSYNPSHEHHQALLSRTLVAYTAAEARDIRGQDIKDAMDASRVLARGVEAWEAYADEVGSGEEDSDGGIVDPEAQAFKDLMKRRAAKRKTKQQRNNKLRVTEEARELALRREMKKRVASVQHVKDVDAEILATKELSLEEKAQILKVRKARLAEQGLTRFRSGPSRVPDASVAFQLGDELAENLRTLQPEGNLWKEWVGSGMRRGKVPVERANESKKGGKRGGRGHDKMHKYKEVEKCVPFPFFPLSSAFTDILPPTGSPGSASSRRSTSLVVLVPPFAFLSSSSLAFPTSSSFHLLPFVLQRFYTRSCTSPVHCTPFVTPPVCVFEGERRSSTLTASTVFSLPPPPLLDFQLSL